MDAEVEIHRDSPCDEEIEKSCPMSEMLPDECDSQQERAFIAKNGEDFGNLHRVAEQLAEELEGYKIQRRVHIGFKDTDDIPIVVTDECQGIRLVEPHVIVEDQKKRQYSEDPPCDIQQLLSF